MQHYSNNDNKSLYIQYKLLHLLLHKPYTAEISYFPESHWLNCYALDPVTNIVQTIVH